MKDNPSIFRPGAIRRYLDRRERTVFPVYAAPRTTLCALLLSAILTAGVLLAALTRVPTYARGAAVLVGREAEAAIFVSPEALSEMRVGQRVFLRSGAKGWLYGGQIKALAPGAGREPGAGALLNLGPVPAGVLKDRAAAALAGPIPPGLTSGDERDGVLEVKVEVGERRLLSFGDSPGVPAYPLEKEVGRFDGVEGRSPAKP